MSRTARDIKTTTKSLGVVLVRPGAERVEANSRPPHTTTHEAARSDARSSGSGTSVAPTTPCSIPRGSAMSNHVTLRVRLQFARLRLRTSCSHVLGAPPHGSRSLPPLPGRGAGQPRIPRGRRARRLAVDERVRRVAARAGEQRDRARAAVEAAKRAAGGYRRAARLEEPCCAGLRVHTHWRRCRRRRANETLHPKVRHSCTINNRRRRDIRNPISLHPLRLRSP